MSANDQLRSLLLDTATRLFAKGMDEERRAARDAEESVLFDHDLWAELEDNGLPTALLPSDAGGADLTWPDALAILRLAGAFALPLPLAETFVAHELLHRAGIEPPEGPIVLLLGAAREPVRSSAGRLRGAGTHGWPGAAQVLVLGEAGTTADSASPHEGGHDGGCLLGSKEQGEVLGGTEGVNLAGEPERRTGSFEIAQHFELPAGTWKRTLELAAITRAVMIAGAMDRVLDLTIEHVQGREQFGRPIARFQAVQQQVAAMTGYVALAGVAAEAAGLAHHSAGRSAIDAALECASAKACASELSGPVARIAHQLVAAIGFTREHELQLFTRRLWTWRDDFGDESFWQEEIGRQSLAAQRSAAPEAPPGAGYWPVLCRS